jgi:hypothetical protein
MNEQLNMLSNDVILDSIGLQVIESASSIVGTSYFLGVKRLERGADHPGYEWVGVVPLPAPCANGGMSWGDLPLLIIGYFWSIQIWRFFIATIRKANGVTRVASRILSLNR